MKLQDKINDMNLTAADLLIILDKSSVSVSWIGSRIVSVQGYEGSVFLDDIAIKLLGMSKQGDLQTKQKESAGNCEKKLNTFYDVADSQWKQSNSLTYSIGYVSRVIFEGYNNPFSLNPYSPKFQIESFDVSENLKD